MGIRQSRGGGDHILEVDNLQVAFDTDAGRLKAVDGVSYSVRAGKTLGIVGESGCGKSVSALAMMRLVPTPPGEIVGGQIRWKGRDLLALPAKQMPKIRGKEIAMIFQDPMTSLNPVYTIQKQMGEVLRLRYGLRGAQARDGAVAALRDVGIADPESRVSNYPHELSGGMKQRVMIAMALMCEPGLLIADEPTTALDVTIQAQILHLMKDLQARSGCSIVFITHDMGVVAEMCDDVAVMYAGKVVERCDVSTLFERNRHPYSRGLLNSIPKKGLTKATRLSTIDGTVPSLLDPPKGCRFAGRCAWRLTRPQAEQDRCVREEPALKPLQAGDRSHLAACHFPVEDDAWAPK
jgi:peptide/nickel transport system ATP-binding protein